MKSATHLHRSHTKIHTPNIACLIHWMYLTKLSHPYKKHFQQNMCSVKVQSQTQSLGLEICVLEDEMQQNLNNVLIQTANYI